MRTRRLCTITGLLIISTVIALALVGACNYPRETPEAEFRVYPHGAFLHPRKEEGHVFPVFQRSR